VKAASLTYRTVLAIVPFLAVLFAIARGFGFENIIQSEILDYLGMTPIGNVPQGESNLTIEIITLINNSLEYARGSGVFAGVGVVLLLYTVFTLFRDIENNFNRIWQIKKGRSMHRRAVDYFALILFLPILMYPELWVIHYVEFVHEIHLYFIPCNAISQYLALCHHCACSYAFV